MTTPVTGRRAGVLLHFTSLPGPEGTGTLGEDARRFIDLVTAIGMREWQVLPVNPPGPGHSPYAARSSFAGNPALISVETLVAEGLLDAAVPPPFPVTPAAFDEAAAWKDVALREAFTQRSSATLDAQRAFEREAAWWLDDWALFAALDHAHGSPWQQWPTALVAREPAALAAARFELRAEVDFHAFVQWLFSRQFEGLSRYAHSAGLSVLGDMPIFPALHSADAWAFQESFKLDERGYPPVIAGVPPDLFSDVGQRWGNPLYDWRAEALGGYRYWKARLRRAFELCDRLRIDHFRGFAAAWEIPAEEPTAVRGEWVAGPGLAFFDAIHDALGPMPIVVEDLGVITEDVRALHHALGFPGMFVLQFAFEGGPENPYLPAHHVANAVVYPGTHDNDTAKGWWDALDADGRARVHEATGRTFDDPAIDLAELALSSPAELAVLPFQDLLGLGSEARMNTPGTPEGNWGWRFTWEQAPDGLIEQWRERLAVSGRLGSATPEFAGE